jgi:hypothetical protein
MIQLTLIYASLAFSFMLSGSRDDATLGIVLASPYMSIRRNVLSHRIDKPSTGCLVYELYFDTRNSEVLNSLRAGKLFEAGVGFKAALILQEESSQRPFIRVDLRTS